MAKPTTTRRKTNAFDKTALLAAIGASTLLKPSRCPIEALDADILVRRLTIAERDQYFADMAEIRTKQGAAGNGNTEAFIYAAANEDNSPMFTLEDYDVVKSLPAELVLAAIHEFNVINRFIVKLPDKKLEGDQPQEDEDLKNS
ncbi:hypothetical protein ACTXKB_13180 [Psychrobacter aquimaris]|uniref:hypothetical protein n=1 Tax=Psychrobacter aquimaris TaxID=292733 RepID=UPI003FD24BD2